MMDDYPYINTICRLYRAPLREQSDHRAAARTNRQRDYNIGAGVEIPSRVPLQLPATRRKRVRCPFKIYAWFLIGGAI